MLLKYQHLSDATGVSLDAAKKHLASFDHEAAHEEEKAKLVKVIWDKKSPINGVPASHFLSRHDVHPGGDGEIYLLNDAATGHTHIFQPHEPYVSGHRWMTEHTVHKHADGHHSDIAEHRVFLRAVDHIKNAKGV